MKKYSLFCFSLHVFIAISFMIQACAQEEEDYFIKVQKETGITINNYTVIELSNESAPGDYSHYFRLKVDSLDFTSVVKQIEGSEYFVDTLVQFPDLHRSLVSQGKNITPRIRWTRAPFGFRYINELQEGGKEFIVCQVNTQSRTFSFRYVQE